MRNKGQMYFGVALVVMGLLFLVGTLFQINVWAICWPAGLILLGVWILLRPRMVSPGTSAGVWPLGGIRRDGAWQVADEEIWLFVGDVELDLTRAEIPIGETKLRIYGFVSDVDVLMPSSAVIALTTNAFVSDTKFLGEKRDSFLAPVQRSSDNYTSAERKVRLETFFFVADVSVKQV